MTYEQLDLFPSEEYSPPDGPAPTSPSQGDKPESPGNGQGSSQKLSGSSTSFSPDGSSWRTYLVSCQSTLDETWEPLSGRWLNAGTGSATGFWTLQVSEFPRNADECSLSDILETTDRVALKYFLTPTACAGLLRRTANRGRKIPEYLESVMRMVAGRQ